MDASRLRHLLHDTIGKRMASLREQSGLKLTQSELARRAGVTRAAISAAEGGQQGLALVTLCRIAAALGVNPASLLPDLNEYRELEEMVAIPEQSPGGGAPRRAREIVVEFLEEGDP